MRGAVQHWYVYGKSGQAAYLFGPQEEQAHKTRSVYEAIYPESSPYLVVVYLISKVDGSLMNGTLDDSSLSNQLTYLDEAS